MIFLTFDGKHIVDTKHLKVSEVWVPDNDYLPDRVLAGYAVYSSDQLTPLLRISRVYGTEVEAINILCKCLTSFDYFTKA
jgi:hypothetical protein